MELSLRRLLLRFLRPRTPDFRLWFWALGLLRLSDGTRPRNRLLSQVRAIPLFCCVIDDTSIDPTRLLIRASMTHSDECHTHFGPDVLPLHDTSIRFAAGRFRCFDFLVRRVTPPFSAGWIPTASTIKRQLHVRYPENGKQ